MAELHIVLLAAGKGTRMKSALPKVLHPACGLPLIEHVLRAADALAPASTVVVVGHEAELVRARLASPARRSRSSSRSPSSGPATRCCRPSTPLAGRRGTVVVLSGDVPLLRPETARAAGPDARDAGRGRHGPHGHASTTRPATGGSSARTGRSPRSSSIGTPTPEVRAIREINSSIYAFDLEPLFDALRTIGSANAQGEYYLPDLVRIYRGRGLVVETVTLDDPTEILGVNSRRELAVVSARLRDRKNDELMAAGVTIVDPATTWIEPDVSIGADTVLHPGVYLQGRTTHRRPLRAPVERPHRRLHAGRRGVREQLLRDYRVAGRRRARGSARSPTSVRSRTSASRRTSATSWS